MESIGHEIFIRSHLYAHLTMVDEVALQHVLNHPIPQRTSALAAAFHPSLKLVVRLLHPAGTQSTRNNNHGTWIKKK